MQIGNQYAIFLGTQDQNYYMLSSMNGTINSIVLSKLELNNLTSVIDFTLKVEEETTTDTTSDESIEETNKEKEEYKIDSNTNSADSISFTALEGTVYSFYIKDRLATTDEELQQIVDFIHLKY